MRIARHFTTSGQEPSRLEIEYDVTLSQIEDAGRLVREAQTTFESLSDAWFGGCERAYEMALAVDDERERREAEVHRLVGVYRRQARR